MALGTIPFEIVNSTQSGVTAAPMRWPICVPLQQAENKLTASTFRVIDEVTQQAVPAAFRIGRTLGESGTRYGSVGDTTKPIKTVLIDLLPTLNAGETRAFTLRTAGGTGDSTGMAAPQVQADRYVIDTGTWLFHVPRTGAQALLSLAQHKATGRQVINAAAGGLWMRGVAAGNPSGQDQDFFSTHDTSGTGATNNGDPTEESRPQFFFTSIVFANSQRVCLKIDTVRCKTAGGTVFRGGNSVQGTGTPTVLEVVWDVYLTFFRNSGSVLRQFVCKSTAGYYSGLIGQASDCLIDGLGVDLVTAFTGTMTVSTRDETATSRVASVSTASASTIRQLTAKVPTSTYGLSLTKTGPLSFTGAPVTQLEAFFDVAASDNGRGVLCAPWNWRNRYPMGWSHTPSTGRLRWEMLNPDHPEVDVSLSGSSWIPRSTEHLLMGPNWFYAEDWLVFHDAALTPAQMVAAVRQTAGVHEHRSNGVYDPSTPTGAGAQLPGLLGHCSATVWDDSRAWRRFAPSTFSLPTQWRTGYLGLTSALGLDGIFADALTRFNRTLDAWLDDSAPSPAAVGFRTQQAKPMASFTTGGVTYGGAGWWGWRYYGCHPTVNSPAAPNDYEYIGSLLTAYLRLGDRGFWALGWEGAIHYACIDQHHSVGVQMGGPSDNGNAIGGRFHTVPTGAGAEYQTQFEAIPYWFLLTGDPVLYEALAFYVTFQRRASLGEPPSNIQTADIRGIGQPLPCTITNGQPTGLSDTTRFPLNSGVWVVPFTKYPHTYGGTLTSNGTTITCSATLPALAPNQAPFSFVSQEKWVGAQIRAPQGTGQLLTATALLSTTQFRVQTAPNPPLVNASWETLWEADSIIKGTVTAKTASSLTLTYWFTSLKPADGTGYTIWSQPVGTVRALAHPMLALLGIAQVTGETFMHAQGTLNLYEVVRDFARHLLYSEQLWSSAGAKAQMGGAGGHPAGWLTGELLAVQQMITHGFFRVLNQTSTGYGFAPLIRVDEFMRWGNANGFSSIFTSADLTNNTNLLDRMARANFTGVDGLSRIKGAAVHTENSIPFTRGGDLASPTSYQLLMYPSYWAYAEEPGRSGLVAEDFRKSAKDVTNLSTMTPWEPVVADSSNSFTATLLIATGADLLAYLAQIKYHPSDPTRRDYYMRMALEMFQQVNTQHEFTGGRPWGEYRDPHTYGGISTWIGSSGLAFPTVRGKGWLMKNQNYVLAIAATGFGGGTADTEAPSQPEGLHVTGVTPTTASLACDPATDNVSVTQYRWTLRAP